MKIGVSIFKDKNIINLIEGCELDYCDITGFFEAVYNTENNTDLKDDFVSLLDMLEESVSSNAKTLKDFFKEWNTFADDTYIDIVLNELFADEIELDPLLLVKKYSIINYNDLSILKDKSWDEFSNDIKYKNRFFSYECINTNKLAYFFNSIKISMKDRNTFFRTRICTIDSVHGFSTSEMGPPPCEKTISGRISPEGIQCLYLSSDKETTFSEARVKNYDIITVGRFINKEELNLVDMSFDRELILSPFGILEQDFIAVNYKILNSLIDNIEKPLRPFDTKLEYLPTQVICCFVKEIMKLDGIKYKSTLVKNGINFAIFNYKKIKCTKVYNYSIQLKTEYITDAK